MQTFEFPAILSWSITYNAIYVVKSSITETNLLTFSTTSIRAKPRSRRDVMQSGQRLEHAQQVLFFENLPPAASTAVLSRILKSLLL